MGGEQDGHYIHGTEPDEQRRLSLLNELMNEGSLRALEARSGEWILDLGSGLGQLSRQIAHVVGPQGRVVGVERDGEQLAEARRRARQASESDLVDFRLGDALDLPLAESEWGSFDVAHTRFLLEHVPRPQKVVDAMVRAVRPGGRVVLEDDDHDLLRLWPEVDGFDRLWRAYLTTYDKLGNDPYIGRRLVSMLEAAGAQPSRNDMLFFGSCAGNSAFEAFVRNFVGLLEGAADTIVESAVLRREELELGISRFQEWGKQSDSALWYVTCWAEGRRAGETGEGSTGPSGQRAPRAREKVSSMRLLAESAAGLNSSLRLDDVFQLVAKRIQQLIDCHLFCVLLWNEDTQLLEHSYSLRFGEHIPQEGGFALGYGISGSAAAEGKPIRVDNVLEDSRYVRYRHSEVEIHSELAVPLIVKNRLIGVLDLESQQFSAFTEEHEQIALTLAGQIATALENARLYEEIHRREQSLENDLATARRIQRALLPGEPPVVKGLEIGAAFAPARELSGDFYDLLRYPDGRVGLALGDVAGKSTAAALYGSLAVGMLRGYALEQAAAPSALLERLNKELYALRVDRRFVALSYVLYDPKTSSLSVGDAGVPQPYLVHNGAVEQVEIAGLPAGALSEVAYQEVRLVLEAGDLLLLCSDGLEDCANHEAERFGERRLREVLVEMACEPAQRVADGLITASDEFATQIDDDRTLLVLRATAG